MIDEGGGWWSSIPLELPDGIIDRTISCEKHWQFAVKRMSTAVQSTYGVDIADEFVKIMMSLRKQTVFDALSTTNPRGAPMRRRYLFLLKRARDPKAFLHRLPQVNRKLKWPNTVIVDPGTEFMGDVTKLMKKHNVRIQRSEAKNHKAQSVVERANRTLSERLYSHQYAQEMLSENERSREWVKRMPKVLEAMNSKPRRISGKEPDKAVGLKEVDVKPVEYKQSVGLDEVRLPPAVKVRYLLAPGEDEGGDNRRATRPVWSLNIYDLSRSVVSVGQPVLYYLPEGAPRRSFVREELQAVPEDTELPPNSVLE
ncbi:predicted protein [Nematostella vectensis]|uniref:Integrase catalytic domain-containing protein n=1 Tax=Nematostella vectensis TaxID=45351 RepID=A7SI44_NEMVE|nr:predicted protein [Nematostella vectensis]|eukprot:XP_001628689.1 predicted protein [Nematostella vectensis]